MGFEIELQLLSQLHTQLEYIGKLLTSGILMPTHSLQSHCWHHLVKCSVIEWQKPGMSGPQCCCFLNVFCSTCGESLPFLQIDLVEQPFDREKNIRKGFCFITFETGDPVEVICVNQKHHVGGRDVRTPFSDSLVFMLPFMSSVSPLVSEFPIRLCTFSQ